MINIRKVFLENLPKQNGKIQWTKSIGQKIKFIYDDVTGYVKLLNVKNGYLFIKYEEFALKNIIREVCDYWNNKEEWETTADLAMKFKINRTTIIRYLKKGVTLHWCDYNGKEEMIKSCSINGKKLGKRVEVFKNNISLGIFESCSELSRISVELFGVKFIQSHISFNAKNRNRLYKGYSFKYVEE